MQRIRVSGPEEVASLLRSVAEGVNAGRIQLGDESFGCSPRISAVVDFPEGGSATVLTMVLHFGEQGEHRPGQVVEQELTHPGG